MSIERSTTPPTKHLTAGPSISADQPNLFRYKKGTKVAQRDADGYADAEWAGVIVDGTWRGDPASGSYKENETYRIRQDQGDSFEADEHALLKRFDSDADLRDEIREKIRTYALPRSTPPARDREGRETIGSLQTGGNCAACGHRIRPGEQGVSYTHTACISSTAGPMRSGSKCNSSCALTTDADNLPAFIPRHRGPTRGEGEVSYFSGVIVPPRVRVTTTT
jgi:hypothetical protein